MCMLLLTFAVLISAASGVLSDGFGLPAWVGMAVVFAAVGVLEFFGRTLVVSVLAYWTVVLYLVFFIFIVNVFNAVPEDVGAAFAAGGVEKGWAVSGFQYALYNITVVPIVLYVARNFDSRREAIGAGGIAAAMVIIPAVVLHVAFSGAGRPLRALQFRYSP